MRVVGDDLFGHGGGWLRRHEPLVHADRVPHEGQTRVWRVAQRTACGVAARSVDRGMRPKNSSEATSRGGSAGRRPGSGIGVLGRLREVGVDG